MITADDIRRTGVRSFPEAYVGETRSQGAASYTTLDLRLAWRPRENLELAAVGRNLLDPRHREWTSVEMQRGGYAQVIVGF